MATEIVTTSVERENKSSSAGLIWSTAKEEGDLVHKAGHADDSTAAADDVDGGFSSLEGMLQWAIGHSDPAKLKESAQDVQRLSPSELRQRQLEIKELMEKLKMPSDAQLMQIALDDLSNSSLSLEDRHRALQELLILVEPIDNANVLELGALATLMKLVNSSSADEATKAFYAVSALIRNRLSLQIRLPLPNSNVLTVATDVAHVVKVLPSDMCKLGGLGVIIRELDHPDSDVRKFSAWILGKASQNNPYVQKQDILSSTSMDVRLRRKAVFLVGDLAECQLENIDKAEMPFFSDQFFLKSVVDLTASSDLDLQEKALVAIKNLLQLRTTEAMVFKEFCRLDDALERMKKQLEDLMLDEDHREYVTDVESLRKEVELSFQAKLGNRNEIPADWESETDRLD
ncbi:hypothetical protein GOBAR_AA06892 [Gossypium barbadense]|uniref:Nucleotide exchange factor Fes1 domain-containing protein n=1 Tax=Gossypium barbadense TaxID=3634 RepID=A0A2P5YDL1_GOSBA|nr:hypothetical protein GOBAR_AA06892 [Gossypium barbadense]